MSVLTPTCNSREYYAKKIAHTNLARFKYRKW